MKAVYENFPEQSIHEKKIFISTLAKKRLQQRLIQVLQNINFKTFTFEDVGYPTIPGCTLIFEVGIADSNSFTFIDNDESKRVLNSLGKEPFKVMDFISVVRYYKDYSSSKKPLKFDYYMLRFIFGEEDLLELEIFHERGPRYVSPKDLVTFLLGNINGSGVRKVLRHIETP